FREARRAEALGEGAAERDLLDRGELGADLGREVAVALAIVIVAARGVDLELLEDRRADFEVARFHPMVAGGGKGVQPQRLL
nr:hypothetical protein [Tanacetum cinerariifolium]